MYLVYEQTSNEINILGITNNVYDAKIKMCDFAKEFIIKKEGTDKLETVNQEIISDDLKDGYYFLKESDKITIILKETNIINLPGWIFNSSNKNSIKNIVKEIKIKEFDKSIIPSGVTNDKDKTINRMSNVINSVKNHEFNLTRVIIKPTNKESKYKKNPLCESIKNKDYVLKKSF